jgi:hypothetical protein
MPSVDEPREMRLHLSGDPEAPPPPPLYSNYIQVTFTPEDFAMHFGWYALPPLSEPPEDDTLNVGVQPVARVVLPLNLMRSVIAVLERQLDAYEQSFGPISEHPNKPPWMNEAESRTEEAENRE